MSYYFLLEEVPEIVKENLRNLVDSLTSPKKLNKDEFDEFVRDSLSSIYDSPYLIITSREDALNVCSEITDWVSEKTYNWGFIYSKVDSMEMLADWFNDHHLSIPLEDWNMCTDADEDYRLTANREISYYLLEAAKKSNLLFDLGEGWVIFVNPIEDTEAYRNFSNITEQLKDVVMEYLPFD